MGKPVIVCIDDEPTALESLKIELNRVLGDTCLIETAGAGKEALELIEKLQHEEYEVALVLAESIMPDITGDELLKQIHTLSPYTLNIMLSEQADLEAVGNTIRDARLYRYISKPWHSDDLSSTVVEAIQSYLQDRKLDAQNAKLQQANQELEQSVRALQQAEKSLRQQAERERILRELAQHIRQSLDLEEILTKTVVEVRHFLQADRVFLYRFTSDYQSGVVAVESVAETIQPWLNRYVQDPCFDQAWVEQYQKGRIQAIADIYNSDLSLCHIDFLAQFQVIANLVIPILQGEQLWGLLVAHQCSAPRQWEQAEIDLLQQLAIQVGIAIHQSQLYQQVQQFNLELEKQVRDRTQLLQRALEFEDLLKRITDKVRDSLDESQILQTVVQELAVKLELSCCDTALYNLDYRTSQICYEYTGSEVTAAKGAVIQMDNLPDIYHQLLQGDYVHCCIIPWQSDRYRTIKHTSAILVCPLRDERGILGDMWLFKPQQHCFSELEVRLVQQVANQCAIALRQSRLYQLAQAQVTELERLAQVKDDFLSTVSHDLRSPMSNIKIALQMLEVALRPLGVLTVESSPVTRYLRILKAECQRETDLINDLLDIARLEAETELLELTPIDLPSWLPQVTKPFAERIGNQQQQFVLDLAPNLSAITTSQTHLERSLTELIHNACKYTPLQETIKVSAEGTPTGCRIQVHNSGVEIPPSERDRIFDKFYRIRSNDLRKQGGTGLGLALVKRQIELLQGTIEVSGQPGWTIFTILLPNLAQLIE